MIDISKTECYGCTACQSSCPSKCIAMIEDEEGFLYPSVDTSKCVNCDICIKVCPAINITKKNNKGLFWGCINKDEDVRKKSSSGGVFHILCDCIISDGGVVFGAAFDEEFNVYHTYAETMDDCDKFKGSKYVQSRLEDSYNKVKSFLQKGRKVLFSGTPCQIAGLYAYLHKEYPNLYTQDIVCHSVPSPKIWNEYKEKICGDTNILNIQFRNKDLGWEKGLFKVLLKDGSQFVKPYYDTSYMRGFLNGLYSRPSCYNCQFSTLSRLSDITLADFWGVSALYPSLYDNRGTSLVIVNSDKGKELFEYARKSMTFKKVNCEKAIWYNPAIYSSVKYNPNRAYFFNEDNVELEERINKFFYNYPDDNIPYKCSFWDRLRQSVYHKIKTLMR